MKHIVLRTAIMFTLLLLGTIIAFIFYREVHYTAIQQYEAGGLNPDSAGPLLKDRIIRGEITAMYDNFGTVKIRVNTYGRFNYDTIHFRLREKGKEQWDVRNAYVVDTFPNKLLYGFGFPVIQDSAGKTYEFELDSDTGTPEDSIGFFPGKYSLASQYVFSKNILVKSPEVAIGFLKAKLLSLLSDPYVLMYYMIFLLPGILYASYYICKSPVTLYAIEIASFLYMLLAYMFIPISISWDTILFIVLTGVFVFEIQSYLALKNTHRISGRTFIASNVYHLPILLILIMLWNIYSGNDLVASRAAIGVFYLTLLSLLLSYRELLYKK